MPRFRGLGQSWTKFSHHGTIILRALGLHILVYWFRSITFQNIRKRQSYTELPKIAIRGNRTSALSRALVHLLPVAAALGLVIINIHQYYVGSSIKPLALYQLIAKLHEVTIQASLTAIIFTYVRHELVFGQGVPLGALFSGLQISQASYLWSMEFWGSLRSNYLSYRRRTYLVVIVIGGIFLAAVVGPSSAVLLVPRLAYWPAGSTHIWINIKPGDLWPIRTHQINVDPDCAFINATVNPWSCPSDEWQSIENYLDLMRQAIPEQYAAEYGYPAPDQVEVTGKGSLRHLHPQRQLWKPYNNSDSQTIIATSQQAAVADALISTGTLWGFNIGSASTGGHGVPQQQLDAIHHIKTGYYQPYTIASCANDTVEGSADDRPLAFPIPPGVLPQMLPEHQINNSLLSLPAFPIQDLIRAEILKTPGSTWETRLRWVELPRDPFNASAIGAVILLPKTSPSPDGASIQKILVCSLGAGWGPSTLNTSTQLLGSSGVKSRISDPEFAAKKVFSYKSTEQDPGLPKAEDVAKLSDGFFVFPAYPERLINVSTNWARYLNPTIVDEGVTVFHRLMQANISDDHPRVSAAIILPSLLANGLARIGFESSLQGDLRRTTNAQGESIADIDSWFRGKGDAFVVDPEQSKEWVKLEVFSTLEGYAYNTSGAGPKVAIIFLLAYCAFAFAHTCYAGISGISSSSWDSIGEVTALAMNSTPNLLLRNTSSGIADAKIFRLPARIFAMPDQVGEGEHLELVLGDHEETVVEKRTLKINRVYG